MTVHRSDLYSRCVQSWVDKNAENLPSNQVVLLFGAAFCALEQRCLVTLSSVTMKVILDRVLFESKAQFPLLLDVSVDQNRINLTVLLENSGSYAPEDLRDGLQHLLVGFLSIVGKITADVLTEPLQKVLMGVTRI